MTTQQFLDQIQDLPDVCIRTDDASRDTYSHDTWPVSTVQGKLKRHPYRPDAIVTLTRVEQVPRILAAANKVGVPVTARGLGSSVTGQPLPQYGGVVLDMSKLVGDPQLDETNLIVDVSAGMCGSDLEEWLNKRGYTTGNYPQSLARSTVGGWLATRESGQCSSRYGSIEDLIVRYTVYLADGTKVPLGANPRAAVGPDLRQLFLGAEGTLGIVTNVALKIFKLPPFSVSEAFRIPSVNAGLTVMRQIIQSGIRPSLVRFYDFTEARFALLDNAFEGCALFLMHEGTRQVAEIEHAVSRELVMAAGGSSLGSQPVQSWLERRYDFSTVEKLMSEPGGYAETIEVAHLWTGIEALHRELTTALRPFADHVLGHFSHVYMQGSSLYVILLGHAPDDETAAKRLDDIWRTAMEVTARLGGEISHHHGAGLARLPYIAKVLGPAHGILQRIKDVLDPESTLNPGKLGLQTKYHAS